MLKAWEAMRLGKDAQIAALMERCKRHEEDSAEKTRTVEALRRKVQAVAAGRGALAALAGQQGGSSAAAAASKYADSRTAAATPAVSGVSHPPSSSGGARHIHVHMHSPASSAAAMPGPGGSPAASASGSTLAAGRAVYHTPNA